MWLNSALSLLPLAVLAFALPTKDCELKVKESVVPPATWTKFGAAPPDHMIKLRIALPQSNFRALEEHLYEISNPYHERYGAHLTKEEVEALVAPHPESVDSVTNWLSSHGIGEGDISRSPAGDWLIIEAPVSLIETMLDTKYHVWKHATTGEYLVRTTSYSLPKYLLDHVDLIQPTTMFGTFRKLESTIHSISSTEGQIQSLDLAPIVDSATGITVDGSCNSTITVNCLKQIYNAVNYTPSADVGNSIAVTGYLDQFANFADLQAFYADQVPAAAAANATFNVVSIAAGNNSQDPTQAGVEANLDVQFAFGLTFPVESTFYTTGGLPPFIPDVRRTTNSNEPYTEWLDFILGHPNPPLAISTSYGDDEQTVPLSYAQRACTGFAQLGARGVSLTVSSGDGGVGDSDPDPATQQCITNDGTNRARFPASCPYITAVGGTKFFPEQAASFSGGGFSDWFARPAYQDSAVNAFLGALPNGTYAGLFNASGRATPDVATQSEFFRVFAGGVARQVQGTSAAAPTFIGIVGLLNDARLKKGLPSLGFLNPLLYSQAASGFNDITVGSNPGCGTPGFNATKGWDAVTGLGT
ncbi:subtilisin-like protein [Mycena metata]|uniref:tripeptidyl-peptidase II n=1 Tax=Mycena metata TaxID=1033252 RepID=A0AAD7P1N4_9AGAR|nr:subtilisin-like protein [Mycena metata]